jgi:hypothetical protein
LFALPSGCVLTTRPMQMRSSNLTATDGAGSFDFNMPGNMASNCQTRHTQLGTVVPESRNNELSTFFLQRGSGRWPAQLSRFVCSFSAVLRSLATRSRALVVLIPKIFCARIAEGNHVVEFALGHARLTCWSASARPRTIAWISRPRAGRNPSSVRRDECRPRSRRSRSQSSCRPARDRRNKAFPASG